jgi:DNA-binding CsgD family transcriptional regulator
MAGLRPHLDAGTVVLTTMLLTSQGPSRHIAAIGVPAECVVEYEKHFHAHDVWLRAAQAQGRLVAGAVTRTDDLVSRDMLRRSHFWRAFLSRYDTAQGLTAVLETTDESGALSLIRFHRGEHQARFGHADVAKVSRWLPHLRNAVKLHRRLAPQLAIGKTLEQLFNEARSPLVFLDPMGRLARHNPAWATWSTSHAEHVRVDARGQITLRDRSAWHSVTKTVRSMVHDRVNGVSVSMHVGNGYQLTLRRVERDPPSAAQPTDDEIIGIVETAEERRPELLRQRFELTPAQSRVALALASGKSPAETAEALGIALATVRTHIAALYGKTGSTRLPGLVAKLLSRE